MIDLREKNKNKIYVKALVKESIKTGARETILKIGLEGENLDIWVEQDKLSEKDLSEIKSESSINFLRGKIISGKLKFIDTTTELSIEKKSNITNVMQNKLKYAITGVVKSLKRTFRNNVSYIDLEVFCEPHFLLASSLPAHINVSIGDFVTVQGYFFLREMNFKHVEGEKT